MQKLAIVTGATSGIGWALSLKLVSKGYKVGATGRTEERLRQLKSLAPEQIEIMVMDVRRVEESVARMYELIDFLGGLDLCVINAGVGHRNPDLELAPELETIDVNVRGFITTLNAAARYFLQQGRGHIVGISSVAALWGNRRNPAYNASKAFELTYLKGIHANLAQHGIHVTDIRPGFVCTGMTKDNPRMFWVSTAEEAADQIYEVIRKRKRVAYITKRWRYVGWLMRLIPHWVYRKIA